MHYKIYKKISWITLLFFFVTLLSNVTYKEAKAAEDTSVEIAAADTAAQIDAVAVLVGDLIEPNGLGSNWEPANYQSQLKEYKNGIYEQSFKLKAGTYDYKIAMNGTWEEGYGLDGGQDNVPLVLEEDQDVTFRLDLVNKEVYDSVNNADKFKTKAILVGGIDSLIEGAKVWDPADDNLALDYVGGGIYKKTFNIKESAKAADYNLEYKVAYNGGWDNGDVSNNAIVTIPAGTSQITFISDYLGNYVSDSVTNPGLEDIVSLIGTVRAGNGDWEITSTEFDMYSIDASKYMFTSRIPAGTYEYKGAINHSWDGGGVPATGNVTLKLDVETNVVFIADLEAGTMVDSVNSPDGVAEQLGLLVGPVTIVSPVINDNGTITFNYVNDTATSVHLAGAMFGGDWGTTKQQMIKNKKGVWSITTRVGDSAQELGYKFVVDNSDWILDPINPNKVDDGYGGKNSLVSFPEYKGRPVTLPGSIQLAIPGTNGTWNVQDKTTTFTYMGNGNYKYEAKDVKAGKYEYKVAINNSWDPENYGANGVDHGSNISIVIPRTMDITFLYNDDSHKIVNSIYYKVLDITAYDGTTEIGKLTDTKLNGVYSGAVDLAAGTYENLTLKVIDDGVEKKVEVSPLTLAAARTVNFYFDPITEICFNDASNNPIDMNGITYDSRSTDYKSIYGASEVNKEIDFSTKIKKDMAQAVKMVIMSPSGTTVLEMEKNGSYSDGSDKWTTSYTPDAIGNYTYYFVVSNGSDIKAYGDDDGFFGTGIAGNIGDVLLYEFNVYVEGFTTPEWLKNGVIYQIYPDRFFNSDTDNDYNQKYARGNTEYDFPADWYSLPKNPQLYGTDGYAKNANTGKDPSAWSNDIYGGDLAGIEEKVNYLKSLGVTVLYLNPVGASISSHRYDTTDYSLVDPILGTMDDFVSLAQAAEKNGMHLILDGVFNHVSDDSIYFDRYGKYVSKGKPLGAYQYWSRVYKNMEKDTTLTMEEAEAEVVKYYTALGITDFHYKDWFDISDQYASSTDEKGVVTVYDYYAYEGWGGYDSMPIIKALDGSEYNVETWADEIIDGEDAVSREWLRNGSDGWRLDVANEVSDETWRAFRDAVKSEGDNAIIGEIWTDASSYILGDMYDSVMNYRFRGAMLGFVQGKQVDDNSKTAYTAQNAANELEKMREQYPREALEAMMNLVDSHDTQRVISSIDGYGKGGENRGFAADPTTVALEKMRLVSLLQMTYIGAPTIYYGDEMGIVGCDDPDNRRGTIWGKGDQGLVEWYAQMAAIRNSYANLRTGDVAMSEVEKAYINDVMAYVRSNSTDKALVAANRLGEDITVTISTPGIADGTILTNAINTGKAEVYTVENGNVTVNIPAYRGVILVDNEKAITVNYEGLKDAYDPSYIVNNRVETTNDSEVIDAIKIAGEGAKVIISSINEGISKNVLNAIVDAGKTLNVVIKRGGFEMRIMDPSGLLEALKDLGQNDAQMIFKENVIKNIAALEKVNADSIVYKFSLNTNLTDGILGTDMELKIPVGTDNDGKTLYLYHIDIDGNFNLESEGMVEGGILTATINHFSDYVVLNERLVVDTPDDTPDGTTDGTTDGTKDGTTNGTTTKTGDNTNILALIAMLFVASGSVVALTRKRRVQ